MAKARHDSPAPLAIAVVLLLIAAGALAPAAQAARGHVLSGSFGEAGSGNGQLTEPAGLAVNEATHVLYVVDKGNNRVERFSSAGAYLGLFDGSGANPGEGAAAPTGKFSSPLAIAVDNSCHAQGLSGIKCTEADPSNGDVYVIDRNHGVIDKFTSGGEYIGQITGTPKFGSFTTEELDGVAVDPHGTLWLTAEKTFDHKGVHRFNNTLINEFEEFIATAGQGFLNPGFAVDSKGDLYLRFQFSPPFPILKFTSTGELLNKAFGGEYAEGPTGIATELSTDDVYVNVVSGIKRFDPSGSQIEALGAANLENGSGVAVDSSTGVVYAADSGADVIDVFGLEPPGKPRIEGDFASDVTATSASLEAEINPRSLTGEAATSYRFEFGRCATPTSCAASPFEQSTPVPEGQLPPDFEVHAVGAHLQNLQPHTAYHFRVIAHNSHPGSAEGEEHTFITQIATPFSLPDGRAWEQVSPIDKRGATIFPIGLEEGPIQASPDGGALTYPASAPTEVQPQGSDADTQVLSARAPAGWSSHDLNIPHPEGAGLGVGIGREYRFFSADLSHSLVHPYGPFDQLSPQATEQTPYLRTDFPSGQPTAFCAESCYRPLVTAAEGLADVPPGTKFGEEGQCPPHPQCGPTAEFATPDLSHVLLKSESGALTVGGTGGSLYEWSAGAAPAEALRLVSVLPGGEAALQQVGPNPGGGERTGARNAVSADGSRVFWSENGSRHLYLRENATEEPSHISGTNVDGSQCTEAAKACTVQLDAVQGGSGAGVPSAHFQLATADGSRVFFTDTQRLTPGSGGESHGGGDLYEYDLERPAGERLADLTPESGGEAAGVQTNVAGASADDSYLYFVADGVLADNTVENGNGPEGAEPGDCSGVNSSATDTCNLYLHHEGATTFIATLSGADRNDFGPRSGRLLGLTVRVSPNGRFFAFMSQRSLTGYDNRDAVSAKPDQEVYLYRAGEGGEEGRLLCASCNPTGARPHGVEAAAIDTEGGGLAGGDFHVWQGTTWLAANVPGWTAFSSSGQTPIAIYQSRYLSDSGRLFFNSSDNLVPSDSNGTEDVYQYEPPGIGSCNEGSPSFGEASGGCVGLISSGTSSGESAFLDASESGDDVFFLTYAKLAPTDPDSSLDVYDARVGGGFPEAVKPVECVGDGCQPPANPPSDATPGSLGFHGTGNLHEEPPAQKKGKKHAKKKHKARHKRARHKRGSRR